MTKHTLDAVTTLVRHLILTSSTKAGSGHPTSSLSATDLMTNLMFGGTFNFFVDNIQHPNNDRLIFSKGHASPLYYALWAVAGGIPIEEMMTLREFGSRLEGHPTLEFPFTEAATGSLGQGLSIGVGMAINAKYLDKLPYKTYVLLGDSEMAEGSNWEAMSVAAHYKLHNLIGIIDINRLGQTGETMHGHNAEAYHKKAEAFGWDSVVIDGHNDKEITSALRMSASTKKPFMIVAKTLKGKGVSFIENQNGWHGKALNEDELKKALKELGKVDMSARGIISHPKDIKPKEHKPVKVKKSKSDYSQPLATRKAYGNALVKLFPQYPNMVVVDAETSNSTFAEKFAHEYPDRFFEMFIAEQNMIGVALGLEKRGNIAFASSFAAFLTRAADQIRMAQYSESNINIVGSHAGVSIGEDGASQMSLEDIPMFRSILGSTVLYPADQVATEKLVEHMIKRKGVCYMRTTRSDTATLYDEKEQFPIGGCKVLRSSAKDVVTIVSAGITLHEALKAHDELKKAGIATRIIDLYSVKPLDEKTLIKAADQTKAIITVEDHFEEGGLGEAVMHALSQHSGPVYSLAVRKMPKSGKPQELLDYEEISAPAIVKKVKHVLRT